MNSLFKLSGKRILSLYITSLLIIFVGAGFVTTIVNNYYENELIESENNQFIDLFVHMSEHTGESNAFSFATHYSNTQNVGIVALDDDGLRAFETEKQVNEYRAYFIESDGRNLTILIDSSNSASTIIRDREEYIINVVLIISFFILLTYIIFSRRYRNKKTVSDIKKIQHLLDSTENVFVHFNFLEFHTIFLEVKEKMSMIDLLQEKRNENLNGLVHDLKTPVTILMNHITSAENSEDLFNNKEAILQSLEDLNGIATDLISDKFRGEQRTINISAYLRKEISKYDSSFKSKNITIKSSILQDANAKWNKRDLARVLRNLLTNAFYYSYPNTVVYVNLLNGIDNYELQIINSGQLIKQSLLSRIFEKSSRNEENQNKDSNGIGLYITKLLVEEVGATIKATSSETENIFTILIPKSIEM